MKEQRPRGLVRSQRDNIFDDDIIIAGRLDGVKSGVDPRDDAVEDRQPEVGCPM